MKKFFREPLGLEPKEMGDFASFWIFNGPSQINGQLTKKAILSQRLETYRWFIFHLALQIRSSNKSLQRDAPPASRLRALELYC
jgi:hypothetical protein